jgi:hypothetical protein
MATETVLSRQRTGWRRGVDSGDWPAEAGVALCFICTARQRGRCLADPPSHAHHQRGESTADQTAIGGERRAELNGWRLEDVLVQRTPASDGNRSEVVPLQTDRLDLRGAEREYSPLHDVSLPRSSHPHTHTHRERERERE